MANNTTIWPTKNEIQRFINKTFLVPGMDVDVNLYICLWHRHSLAQPHVHASMYCILDRNAVRCWWEWANDRPINTFHVHRFSPLASICTKSCKWIRMISFWGIGEYICGWWTGGRGVNYRSAPPAAAIIIVSLAHAAQVWLCCRPTSLHVPRMFTKMCTRVWVPISILGLSDPLNHAQGLCQNTVLS